jgi:hypothetical protein
MLPAFRPNSAEVACTTGLSGPGLLAISTTLPRPSRERERERGKEIKDEKKWSMKSHDVRTGWKKEKGM